MSAHFKWYPSSEESIVPWNARYSFPSQANKAEKTTPRISPKNGAEFGPGSTIRLEFPAQGYVNPLNTTLEFDVQISSPATPAASACRFQNNIQSIFSRGRLLYGSTPLEDLINMNTIVRLLTNWTATNVQGVMDQTSIAEGCGGYVLDSDSGGTFFGHVNARQKYIHSSADTLTGTASANFTDGLKIGPAGVQTTENGVAYITQRYQINLPFGLLTQDKLIPTKFMASALAIELTLETADRCMYQTSTLNSLGSVTSQVGTYGYRVLNVNLIPEVVQFDASYGTFF